MGGGPAVPNKTTVNSCQANTRHVPLDHASFAQFSVDPSPGRRTLALWYWMLDRKEGRGAGARVGGVGGCYTMQGGQGSR